jgi:hypothetical protein
MQRPGTRSELLWGRLWIRGEGGIGYRLARSGKMIRSGSIGITHT